MDAADLYSQSGRTVPAPVRDDLLSGDVVWGKDPEEVRKITSGACARWECRTMSPGVRWKRLVHAHLADPPRGALTKANVKGVADYVRTAAGAANAREALFFVESAEMLQRLTPATR